MRMEEESLPIERDRAGAFVSPPLKEDLAFRAVACNDLDTLVRLVDDGYDVNTIHIESRDGPFFIIHDFSRMVRQICLKSYTLLHVAVIHANMDLIRYLLSKGVDVNLSDVNKMSPLSLSAVIQRPDVAKVLLESGANINVQSVSGRTPIIEAVASGCLPLVDLLVKAGCDLELTDLKDTTPLVTSITSSKKMSKIAILRSLIEGGVKIDRANKQGATAFLTAIGMGLSEAATVLLEAGADINTCDKQGKTVVHHASGPNTLLYLLSWGASSDRPDKKGERPLDRALNVGNIGMIRVLLGADTRREYSLVEKPIVVQIRQQFPAFDRWILNEVGNPRPLMRLCRQVIRESLSPRNTPNIKELPIPSPLKDFLLMKNLDLRL